MDKKEVLEIIGKVRENSKKRNFKQKFDLVFNLKDLDLKKAENNINSFTILPYSIKGKKIKVCALIDKTLVSSAKDVFDKIIISDDFDKIGKKEIKKLGKEYDFFVAQGDVMSKVASVFGKTLGPYGKMPSPKLGCVIGLNSDLKSLYTRLQKMILLNNKKQMSIKCIIGSEDMNVSEICENVLAVYNSLTHESHLENRHLKSVILKLTMGQPEYIKEDGK